MLRRRDEQAGEELIRAGLRKEGIDASFGHQAFGVVELALDGAQLARLPLTGHEVDATVRSSAPAAARTRYLYPRARGADHHWLNSSSGGRPLPPRTRGRRQRRRLLQTHDASTPAHAGPTGVGLYAAEAHGLYPRARGADYPEDPDQVMAMPLPPRTRGRPAVSYRPGTAAYLYPRARGADTRVVYVNDKGQPLPPRTRGRQPARQHLRRTPPSTPAHAGPTLTSPLGTARTCLYPRARGADA